MQSAEWVKLIRRIPPDQRELLTLMTGAGMEIALQSVVRTEEHYVVVRGRLSGTNDQDRVFFLPYDQIVYAGFIRPVPLATIARMYAEGTDEMFAAAPPPMMEEEPPIPEAAAPVSESPPPEAAPPQPQPKQPSRASVSKATLLQRIRARTTGSDNRAGRR